MNDLKFAVRTLRKSPGFTATAVLTLALGIGANTAIFSLVHAVILKPLPFREPAQLVAIWDSYRPQFDKIGISPAELAAWQQQSDLFSESAWYRSVPQDLPMTSAGTGGEAVEVHADPVSASLFPLLGAAPALGRPFTESDPPNTVVLSERVWRTRFAGDPEIAALGGRLRPILRSQLRSRSAESSPPTVVAEWDRRRLSEPRRPSALLTCGEVSRFAGASCAIAVNVALTASHFGAPLRHRPLNARASWPI